jgi:nucleotide-binding universal stress UspA family protein
VDATPDASGTRPPAARGLVVGVAPGDGEQHVLARAVDDAVLGELDGVLALVVVEAPPFGWLWPRHGQDLDLAALHRAVRARIGRQVDLRVVEGAPVSALTDGSADAAGLYLGRGPAPGVGPVVLGCTSSARCPVTVVPRREPAGPRGPVVVGLDDSQCAREAVEHAIDEGGRIEGVVLVVSVFDASRSGTGRPTASGAREEARRAVEVRTRSTVRDLLERRVRARRPGVAVEVGVLEGPPASMLCEVAGRVGASLLVVGARGRGHADVGRSPIGSVATRVVLRAPGTVRIIRGRLR